MLTLTIKNRLFNCIYVRSKVIDVRLRTVDTKKVVVGDTITFVSGARSVQVTVIGIRTYPDFEAMLAAENYIPIAPMATNKAQVLEGLRKLYGDRDREKGVIVFEFPRQL